MAGAVAETQSAEETAGDKRGDLIVNDAGLKSHNRKFRLGLGM